MDDLIFYAILFGIICTIGAGYAYWTEFRPTMHRKNKCFGEMLRQSKAELETSKLAAAREFLSGAHEKGLVKV